jgi:uncharacterized protein
MESIVKSIENDITKAKVFISVRDLKYLIKSGRVSRPKGLIAGVLGLNPVISIDENGKTYLFGNTFSQQASLKKIYSHIEKISRGKTIWNYILLHAHNPEGAKIAGEKMMEIIGKEPVSVLDISPAIGIHAGKGAIAIALLYNN